MYNGEVNPFEKINTQVIYCTSAGTKSSYAYGVLIDTFENTILNPKANFCIGLDYRIPVMHGLISKDFVQKLRLSSSYNEQTFAAEYLGKWLGGGEDSWYDFNKISKYRVLKNPEWKARSTEDGYGFYVISCDIGRIHDQTVLTVFLVVDRGMKRTTLQIQTNSNCFPVVSGLAMIWGRVVRCSVTYFPMCVMRLECKVNE